MDLVGRVPRPRLHPADRCSVPGAVRRLAKLGWPDPARRNSVTLMRFDPYRELERLADQALSVGARATRSMPMAALRRGAEFLVFLDVPGVHPEDIEVTV